MVNPRNRELEQKHTSSKYVLQTTKDATCIAKIGERSIHDQKTEPYSGKNRRRSLQNPNEKINSKEPRRQSLPDRKDSEVQEKKTNARSISFSSQLQKDRAEKRTSSSLIKPENAATSARSKELQEKDGGQIATPGILVTKKSQESIRTFKTTGTGQTVSFDNYQGIPGTSSKAENTGSLVNQASPTSLSNDRERRDIVKLRELYNQAIEIVQKADESLLCADKRSSSTRGFKQNRRHSDIGQAAVLEIDVLRELEAILNDARFQSSRRGSDADSVRSDTTCRSQKKRIELLEKVLMRLNPNRQIMTQIDPFEALRCNYLRLSKSNVETLENMIKEQGKDPGIHAHSDLTNINIWEGLQDERTDLKNLKKQE